MCGIAGFFNPSADYTKEKNYRNHILEMMNQVQKHRGPDDEGTFLSPQCGLAHVRLNIIDLVTGHQPMRRVRGDHSCVIAYNGEIYNAPELKAELISEGEQFLTSGDTEVILAGFMRCGPSFIKKLTESLQSRCGMNLVKRFICSATGSVSNLSFIQKKTRLLFFLPKSRDYLPIPISFPNLTGTASMKYSP